MREALSLDGRTPSLSCVSGRAGLLECVVGYSARTSTRLPRGMPGSRQLGDGRATRSPPRRSSPDAGRSEGDGHFVLPAPGQYPPVGAGKAIRIRGPEARQYPAGADGVVRVEDTRSEGSDVVVEIAGVKGGPHRQAGEDVDGATPRASQGTTGSAPRTFGLASSRRSRTPASRSSPADRGDPLDGQRARRGGRRMHFGRTGREQQRVDMPRGG